MTRAADLFEAAERQAEARCKEAQRAVERASVGYKHFREAKLRERAHDALRAGVRV